VKTTTLPILQQLQKLKFLHENSCVKSSIFQPNDEQQEKLIVKNFAAKMVSAAIKKKKKLYKEFLKDAEFKRKHLGIEPVIEDFQVVKLVPPPPLSIETSDDNTTLRPIDGIRPASAKGSSHFLRALKNISSIGQFDRELRWQAETYMRNAKTMFDAMVSSYKNGLVCKCNLRRYEEVIDASAIVGNLIPVSSLSSTKLEDANQVKKKEGINLIIDPTYCSGNDRIIISITYQKPLDLNNTEEVVKLYPAWSQVNNSFNLRLTSDYANSYIAPPICSLPGWQGRPPIFIPVAKCSVKILIEREDELDSTTKYKLSNVSFFVWPGANARSSIKKLNEFCGDHFLKQVSNAVLPGGISALSEASLHGNLEAVVKLIANGASINTRNKLSKFNTALHEAVIGGHMSIVMFLLKNGANQVLKDENGCIPLHLACMLGDISIVKLLITADKAKKALLMVNNNDQKALDLCKNNYLKMRVEDVMRKLNIFAKPRVSILERTAS